MWDDEEWIACKDGIGEGCEHEWGDESKISTEVWDSGPRAMNDPSTGKRNPRKDGQLQKVEQSQGQFCQKCNAWRGSLGLEPTPELFIQHIVQVFREIWRVLRKDGTVWLNLGDSYATSSPHGSGYGEISRTAGVGNSQKGVQARAGCPAGLKPKDLCGIPWRVALALQADGWWLRSDIIWNKPNPMPESVTDRPTRAHEYVFLLTKSGTSKFWTHRDRSGTRARPKADYRWVNQISEIEVDVAPPDWKDIIICPRCEGTGIAMIDLSCEVMGQWMESWVKDKCPICEGKKKVQKWKRINLWGGHDYFYDQEAVREPHSPDGRKDTQFKGSTKYANGFGPGASMSPLRGHERWPEGGRNLRSVWTIATQPFPEAHFATFPEKLVEPCIKAGTSEKGCCPECGAPWVRVVEREKYGRWDHGIGNNADPTKVHKKRTETMGDSFYENYKSPKTIGWRPSCECLSDDTTPGPSLDDGVRLPFTPIPCTVLDPFGGSGRTAIIAKKLGQKCISIELKESYCSMPLKELSQEVIF